LAPWISLHTCPKSRPRKASITKKALTPAPIQNFQFFSIKNIVPSARDSDKINRVQVNPG
jgi:hypothetical protein